MHTQTCPAPEQLVAFLQGKLPAGEAEAIAEHLEACAACERQASSLEAVSDEFMVELKRPTGDAQLLGERNYRRAAQLVAAIGLEPTSAGVDRQRAAAEKNLGMLGQYRLLEKLGAGGMGTVYKALHVRLEKIVAVKVLPFDRLQDEAAIARFEREMKAVGRLDHPHIVRAMDAGDADGVHYLVMEYVAGIDLSTLSRRVGPLPIADACELVRQAAIGLSHAHEFGLVHRDIKPGNLILASGERQLPESALSQRPTSSFEPSHIQGAYAPRSPTVKILDLGLALLSDGHHISPQRELTSTGQMMGTLDYMAPEQGSDSHVVDIRADVYSLGATLYKLLTGDAIYHGAKFPTPVQKMIALATQPAPPIQSRRSDVPDALAVVVHRMLEKDPAQRYATPHEVAMALAPFAADANLVALAERAIAESAKDTVAEGSHPRSKGSTVIVPAPRVASRRAVKTARSWHWPLAIVGAALAGLLALAAVFLLQTPQGTVSVKIDPEYGKDVAIVVRGNGEKITLSDASGWEVKLREGTYEVALGRSADRFKLDQETLTINRGEHEVVRVTLKPPDEPAEIAPADAIRKASSDAVAWLIKHNAFGPESELVVDARKKISNYASRGVGFEYRLAGPLLASGKPTVLAVHGPRMFVHELTPAQADAMNLVKTPIAGFRSGPEQVGRRAGAPEFRLADIKFDDPEILGSDGKIRAWVNFERLRPGEPKAHYFLRIVTFVDGAVTTAQGIAGDLADEKGAVRLEIDSPLPLDWSHVGTTIFVELGRFDRVDDFNQFVALSDPISTVIVLQQAP